MELPLWKKLLFTTVAVVGALGLLEIGARLLVKPQDTWIHQEHEAIINVLGLPELNATMEFDPDLFWILKDGLTDFRVTGSIRGRPIDFRMSTRGHLRVTPQPPVAAPGSSPPLRILAVGDSCTFGLGVNDAESWPARLAVRLAAAGQSAMVVNSGVPGYSAFQGRRFLELHGDEFKPDVVVATFGFNDYDSWGDRSDLETARDLRIAGWERRLMFSRLYQGLRSLLRATVLKPKAPVPPGDNVNDEGRSRLTPSEFEAEMEGIHAWCQRRFVRLILIVWPYAGQVTQHDPDRIGYQQITAWMCREKDLPCVDLVSAFRRAQRPVFLDHVHANPYGCDIAARQVAVAIGSAP